MGYNKSTYDLAKDRLYSRRRNSEKSAEERKKEVYSKIPKAEAINIEIANCGLGAAKAVVKGGNVKEEMKKLKRRSLYLQEELKTLLLDNGFSEDYMDIKYVCNKCEDTGSYEYNNKTLVCSCHKKLLTQIAYEELNSISPLKLSTFDTFKLKHYSKEKGQFNVSPYNRMKNIFNYCQEYANEFIVTSESLLLRGATGLGKTHLSLAIANELIGKGFGVVYVSAPVILSKLEKEHFSGDHYGEEQTLKTLNDCDLLIIDDLGTEFLTSFSKSTIYNIFNTRILLEKPIIFNTNLTLKELEESYSQRFISRVMGNCTKLDFIGTDIRYLLSKK